MVKYTHDQTSQLEKEILDYCSQYVSVSMEGEILTDGYLSLQSIKHILKIVDDFDEVVKGNNILYNAVDALYSSGWDDRHCERDYDPRGTAEWQAVVDVFRSQKEQLENEDI
jgi:hypothetical protein